MMGIVKRDSWEMTYSKDVGHKKEISHIQFLTDDKMVTAGLDKVIKVWEYPQMKLLNYIVTEREILSI